MPDFIMACEAAMSEDIGMQKYKELLKAVRDREEAARRLEACNRRIAELSGLMPENASRKPSKKTITREEFRAACSIYK